MVIVVTGATGRLGKPVVRRLVDRGYEVLATDRVASDESPAVFLALGCGQCPTEDCIGRRGVDFLVSDVLKIGYRWATTWRRRIEWRNTLCGPDR